MNSVGPSSWEEESEKENFYTKSRNKATELDTLVTFLSKFDSKVAAIWDNEKGDKNVEMIWQQQDTKTSISNWTNIGQLEDILHSPSSTVEENLFLSSKTHFRPIRDIAAEEIQYPHLLPFPNKEDPAEYAIYNLTANNMFPLQFKIKKDNDKAVQTDFQITITTTQQFQI